MLGLEEFKGTMADTGIVIFENVVPKDLISEMREDLYSSYEKCREIQVKNGISEHNEYTTHHLIILADSFMKYLEWSEIFEPYLQDHFGRMYILNSFGGAINKARSRSYAHEIHCDVRSYSPPELPFILNTLVMLDDFTEDNGATYLLPGSHKAYPQKPDKDEFFANAIRATAPAGSVLMFNSNVWHAGGDNQTDKDRCSVTPMYCQPFFKPQFDYPRAFGYDKAGDFSEFMSQLLGYNARTPATLDEWYQPPENRMYKPTQEANVRLRKA